MTQEIQDEALIQSAFQKLIDTYLASPHRKKTEIITKAFNFAKAAHRGVRRRSGEPYILHPIAVAQVCCEEMGMGSTTICAALLHDVVEDTDYTRDDIANLFGEKIANIVEGVTKVSGGLLGNRASMQAETFKKILLTMSDDIRVILVKIADRLHNMRTLSSMLPSRQYKIVGETLYIFAPLADRLGLNRIKTELEDLSFKYEHPDDYNAVMQHLKDSKLERDDAINDFTPAIRQALDAQGIDYE
ncbi:MAG: HD domain-containing protein, partial [Alloprevotella sp.]